MELLGKRHEAVQQISAYLRSASSVSATALVNGRSKGKQKEGASHSQRYFLRRSVTSVFLAGPAGLEVLSPEDARRRMEETLRANAARPLYTGTAVSARSRGFTSVRLTSSTIARCPGDLTSRLYIILGSPRESPVTYWTSLYAALGYHSELLRGTSAAFSCTPFAERHFRITKKLLCLLHEWCLHVNQNGSYPFLGLILSLRARSRFVLWLAYER